MLHILKAEIQVLLPQFSTEIGCFFLSGLSAPPRSVGFVGQAVDGG